MEHRYGIASKEEIADLSGRALLEAIVAGTLPQAPISEALSFWLVEVGDGTAAFEGEPHAALRNPAGTVHGGWAATLVDSATGCAAHSQLAAGAGYATIETKVNFVRPILASTGRVRCEARVVSRGRQVASAEAYVRDAAGKLLAHGTSTVMILERPGG